MLSKPDLEKAREYVLHRLDHELSPNLTYHSLVHTQEEVVPAVDLIATLENTSAEEHLLLLTAAYYHDLGFIRQRKDHEMISIEIAGQTLPGFGYSNAQVEVIRGIIHATCLPQSPANLPEQIMVDADLDYLGNQVFWARSNDYRLELEHFEGKFTDEEWYSYELRFMQSHQYFTGSARALREPLKQQHIQEITCLLDQDIREKLT